MGFAMSMSPVGAAVAVVVWGSSLLLYYLEVTVQQVYRLLLKAQVKHIICTLA